MKRSAYHKKGVALLVRLVEAAEEWLMSIHGLDDFKSYHRKTQKLEDSIRLFVNHKNKR